MLDRIKREPFGKAALIVATMALIVALGGAAIAAVKLQNGQVTGKKLAKNAVTTKKIKNGAVRANKLTSIRTATKTLNVNTGPSSAADTVTCEPNELVIGGGAAYIVTNQNQHIMIRSSFKDLDANGWRVAVHNAGAGARQYTIEAYCMRK